MYFLWKESSHHFENFITNQHSSTGALSNCTVKQLGCWADKPSRAIVGGIRFTSDYPIKDCQKYAVDRKWTIFAIQYSNECFTAANAGDTYQKYGASLACSTNRRGGVWAQNVYSISCFPDNERKVFPTAVIIILSIMGIVFICFVAYRIYRTRQSTNKLLITSDCRDYVVIVNKQNMPTDPSEDQHMTTPGTPPRIAPKNALFTAMRIISDSIKTKIVEQIRFLAMER